MLQVPFLSLSVTDHLLEHIFFGGVLFGLAVLSNMDELSQAEWSRQYSCTLSASCMQLHSLPHMNKALAL